MEVKYRGKTNCFDVPDFHPFCLVKPGWSDVLEYAVKNKLVAYCKNNGHGKYLYGSMALVHYVDPNSQYIVVSIDGGVDSWFEILTADFDCIGRNPQELLDGMEAGMGCFKTRYTKE